MARELTESLGAEHRQHRYLNNPAKNSHQPTRQRERRMGRFSPQETRAAFSLPMAPSRRTFNLSATSSPARAYRQEMTPRFQTWREITGTAIATYGKRKTPLLHFSACCWHQDG